MSELKVTFDKLNKACKEANEKWKKMMEENNPFDTISNIAKDIADRQDREKALEFTKRIGKLLRENGVTPMVEEYKTGGVLKNDKTLEEYYGVAITGLDFTEHDKPFERSIKKLESLRYRCHESARDSFDNGNYGILHIVTADELKNDDKVKELQCELDKTYNQLMEDEKDAQEQIAELESELEAKDNLLKIKNGLCGNDVELPCEPISVAEMLINAKIEYEPTSLQKALFKTDGKFLADKYSDDDLEQIAEHLLLYCKHSRKEDEQ